MILKQQKLFSISAGEARRERSCYVCHGIQSLCTDAVCPIKLRAKTLVALNKAISSTNLYGASPPGVFVGQHGYPRVSLGPLIPPIADQDTSIMDSPENWLYIDLGRLLEYRLSLLRARTSLPVDSPRNPPRMLSDIQELVMSAQSVNTEAWFNKKPRLEVLISPREAPIGPSATVTKFVLTENPRIPRQVDKVISDTAMPAEVGVLKLYQSRIAQRQITRMFSVGLLGAREKRRLVPTEWSITAIDDLLARGLRTEILSYSMIDEYLVFGHEALANNLQVLLMPTGWMYEAMEAWLGSTNPIPLSDYELSIGRKTYPRNLAGAYHAARLPVLEYLQRIRRQGGAIVFMEVGTEWIPLVVWRFREICREAMCKPPAKFRTVEQAFSELEKRLRIPISVWIKEGHLISYHKEQHGLERFMKGV
jgi:hypothetical protein